VHEFFPLPYQHTHRTAHVAGDTMYLTVADNEGNMISLIQSNYEGFGSGLVIPGVSVRPTAIPFEGFM
jgi:gamma-glutamyltranspeptidase